MRNSPSNKGSSNFDNPLAQAVALRDADIVNMVRDAVEHNQTMLAYQGVIIANDLGRVGFYEGLFRVTDETGRVIPAKDFIHAVERTELGREIDRLALRMGLQMLQKHANLRLSINMSARSIGYQPWLSTLNTWLRKDATIGERLILEITESSAIEQPEITMDFMERLTRHGICFALDDFGSGYTALRYLKDFYFDIVKIDGAFCQGVADDPDKSALVKAMLSIASHFDMLAVAEGVERGEDVRALVDMGVDCLQGFYFHSPTTRPTWAYGQIDQDPPAWNVA